jgi:hypothetical protein
MAMKRQPKKSQRHLAAVAAEIVPSKSVFINCPYDAEFEPLFDAIVFAATCCGFWPRSALESGCVAEPRMERIARAVFSSKYSIHDLSRCKGEGDENLARFNMPMELGIAMGRRMAPTQESDQHDWLVMVREGHPYVKYLSDLGGFDPSKHNGTVEGLIPAVMSWLYTRPGAIAIPKPRKVVAALKAFRRKKARLVKEWGSNVPWAELILAAREAVPPLE